MGVIQSTVNQAMAIGAVAASQTPLYKRKQAEQIAKADYKGADKALKTIVEEPTHSTAPEVLKKTLESRAESAQKAFAANPTPENLQTATGAQNVKSFSDRMEQLYTPENLANNPNLLKLVQARMKALQDAEMKRENKTAQNEDIQNNIKQWGEIDGKK